MENQIWPDDIIANTLEIRAGNCTAFTLSREWRAELGSKKLIQRGKKIFSIIKITPRGKKKKKSVVHIYNILQGKKTHVQQAAVISTEKHNKTKKSQCYTIWTHAGLQLQRNKDLCTTHAGPTPSENPPTKMGRGVHCPDLKQDKS